MNAAQFMMSSHQPAHSTSQLTAVVNSQKAQTISVLFRTFRWAGAVTEYWKKRPSFVVSTTCLIWGHCRTWQLSLVASRRLALLTSLRCTINNVCVRCSMSAIRTRTLLAYLNRSVSSKVLIELEFIELKLYRSLFKYGEQEPNIDCKAKN